MHKNPSEGLPHLWQRSCKTALCISWIFGLMFGIWLSAVAGDSFFLTMRGADFSAVSIPGLLLVTALPFLITATAVFLSQPWLLICLVLLKAAAFGFCACGIIAAYGSASWLVSILLMFTDLCALPQLMWLWLRHGDMTKKALWGDLSLCLSMVMILGILDYSFVMPFAASLL